MIKLGPSNALSVDRSVLAKKDPVLTKNDPDDKTDKAGRNENPRELEAIKYREALAKLRDEKDLQQSKNYLGHSKSNIQTRNIRSMQCTGLLRSRASGRRISRVR